MEVASRTGVVWGPHVHEHKTAKPLRFSNLRVSRVMLCFTLLDSNSVEILESESK